MELTVKVGKLPGRLTEVVFVEGTKVKEAIALAGLSSTGFDIRMDGETVSLETTIPNTAQVIVLAKQIKGNADLTVKVGKLPGRLEEIAFVAGTKVGEVISIAGLTATGFDIRMDGETVKTDTVVPATAQVIVLAKQIKGNN